MNLMLTSYGCFLEPEPAAPRQDDLAPPPPGPQSRNNRPRAPLGETPDK